VNRLDQLFARSQRDAERILQVLGTHGLPGHGPRGVILGTVELVDIVLDCDCSPWAMPGHFHWKLANPERLDEPIPYTGALGLWDWPQ
jgi:hypothetical protein